MPRGASSRNTAGDGSIASLSVKSPERRTIPHDAEIGRQHSAVESFPGMSLEIPSHSQESLVEPGESSARHNPLYERPEFLGQLFTQILRPLAQGIADLAYTDETSSSLTTVARSALHYMNELHSQHSNIRGKLEAIVRKGDSWDGLTQSQISNARQGESLDALPVELDSTSIPHESHTSEEQDRYFENADAIEDVNNQSIEIAQEMDQLDHSAPTQEAMSHRKSLERRHQELREEYERLCREREGFRQWVPDQLPPQQRDSSPGGIRDDYEPWGHRPFLERSPSHVAVTSQKEVPAILADDSVGSGEAPTNEAINKSYRQPGQQQEDFIANFVSKANWDRTRSEFDMSTSDLHQIIEEAISQRIEQQSRLRSGASPLPYNYRFTSYPARIIDSNKAWLNNLWVLLGHESRFQR